MLGFAEALTNPSAYGRAVVGDGGEEDEEGGVRRWAAYPLAGNGG